MSETQRGVPENGDATSAPGDEATTADVPVNDEPVVVPVPEKIGEGGTNLRDRNAALSRRRGRDQPSR
jgi:hypothetical protein